MSLPFALSAVQQVIFYKRDELTTDLICCEVTVDGTDGVLFNHEESRSWESWIEALNNLPGFDGNWFSKVSQPPFEPNRTVAFVRPVA